VAQLRQFVGYCTLLLSEILNLLIQLLFELVLFIMFFEIVDNQMLQFFDLLILISFFLHTLKLFKQLIYLLQTYRLTMLLFLDVMNLFFDLDNQLLKFYQVVLFLQLLLFQLDLCYE